MSTLFTNIEPNRNKLIIEAVQPSGGREGQGRGRGRGRHGGRGGQSSGGRQKVIMNGIDLTDVSCNFSTDEWEKLTTVGGHAHLYQRCKYLRG